ncbi:NTP transferase domain-containing protein [Sphingobacterium sp. E70]|uniref:MobA-like NTP transferase domain-containing protein n=2 Tax=Sphingobacteriaceae TaxID=84566 RepID=A0ABP7ZW98_9SPHI|nr:NTP transferase domain-containing protein [Sphingobacterium sp. E70]
MGSPKEKMHWHGKEQVYYLADMLRNYCDEVYISCRAEQLDEIAGGEEMASTYAWLSDRYTDIGPMGGILTAFEFRPERAWLVVACDLPLVDSEALAYLIQHRDPQRIATAFKSPQDSSPEPLLAIWEPSSLPILQQMQAQHKLSPRRALIQHQALGIEAPHVNTLVNVNTPAEADSVKAIINNND